jgi:DNA-binding FadR family transcriptional regulator
MPRTEKSACGFCVAVLGTTMREGCGLRQSLPGVDSAMKMGVGFRSSAMQTIIDTSFVNLRDGRNLADDDEAFHLALIGAAKNPIVLRISRSLYLITRSVRLSYFEVAGSGPQSIKEHTRILERISRRDATGAAKLMQRHYAGSSARWRKVHTSTH